MFTLLFVKKAAIAKKFSMMRNRAVIANPPMPDKTVNPASSQSAINIHGKQDYAFALAVNTLTANKPSLLSFTGGDLLRVRSHDFTHKHKIVISTHAH